MSEENPLPEAQNIHVIKEPNLVDATKIETKIKKACASDLKALAKLLDQGVDPNLVFLDGGTLMAYACKQRDEMAALRLLARGANPKSLDRSGKSVLSIAAERNLPKLCRALVIAGADPFQGPDTESSPVGAAAAKGASAALASMLSANKEARPYPSPLRKARVDIHLFAAAKKAKQMGSREIAAVVAEHFQPRPRRDIPKSATSKPLLAYGVLYRSSGSCVFRLTSNNLAKSWPWLSCKTRDSADQAAGAFPCFDLATDSQSVERLMGAIQQGHIGFQTIAELDPARQRIAHAIVASWMTFLNAKDPQEKLCEKFFTYLEAHPDASESELAAVARPIFDAGSASIAKTMFDMNFANESERTQASLAAMGERDSSPVKAARESTQQELAELKDLLVNGKDKTSPATSLALECADKVAEAMVQFKRPLASLWGSRRIYNIDREIVDQFKDAELPVCDDGSSMAGALAKRTEHKGMILSYCVEHPLSPPNLPVDFAMTWAIGIENDGKGNPVLHLACAKDPATNMAYACQAVLTPDFDLAKLREAVAKGLQDAIWLEKGASFIENSVLELKDAMAQNALFIRQGMDLTTESINFATEQAKIAINALGYSCSSDPHIRREAKITSTSKKLAAFSVMAQIQAATIKPPKDVSVGWDALWLGVDFGDYARQYRSEAEPSDGDDPILKRRITPHPRKGHWRGTWAGPLDGLRHLKASWIDPTFVGAKSTSDISNHRPKGIKAPLL